jgi:hypothetical protein
MPETAAPAVRHLYVTTVLQRYCATRDTSGRSRPADRRLAAQLYEHGVPLDVVTTAFMLATLRRAYRAPDAEPLEPICSLHYFRPIIAELLQHPIDATYLDYIRWKLDDLPPTTPPPDNTSDDDIPW